MRRVGFQVPGRRKNMHKGPEVRIGSSVSEVDMVPDLIGPTIQGLCYPLWWPLATYGYVN